MILAGVKAGDEVIVPAHTFLATASAVVNVGGTPVLVDVGRDYNIDVRRIEEKITPRTKAIIPVHLNGRPADMETIMALTQKHKLIVVEDARQSLGQRSRKEGHSAHWVEFLPPLKFLWIRGRRGIPPMIRRQPARPLFSGITEKTGNRRVLLPYFTCLLDNPQAAFWRSNSDTFPGGSNETGPPPVSRIIRYPRSDSTPFLRSPDGRGLPELRHPDALPGSRSTLESQGVEIIHRRKPYYAHWAGNGWALSETEAISEVISCP
jgi:hypothetical protein